MNKLLYVSQGMDKTSKIVVAKEIANKLLSGDDNYLDNVIKLWKIGNALHGQCWDTEFHIFGVIESETDHLPTNSVRPMCSKEFLAKSDNELSETIEYYKNQVSDACNQILAL